jgi:hypothetical protein
VRWVHVSIFGNTASDCKFTAKVNTAMARHAPRGYRKANMNHFRARCDASYAHGCLSRPLSPAQPGSFKVRTNRDGGLNRQRENFYGEAVGNAV